MPSEYGGAGIFNGPSPSSDPGICNRIVADYITPSLSRPRRVLDVGGTAAGFRANATMPEGTELVAVNPSGPPDAEYRSFADIPANDPGFDFAMLFGVLMYCDHDDAVAMLREIRVRLRGTHPTLLVAEPNPVSIAGFTDALLKTILISPVRILSRFSWKSRFHIYARSDAEKLLFEAGFTVATAREGLNPTIGGIVPHLPVYYVIAASI